MGCLIIRSSTFFILVLILGFNQKDPLSFFANDILGLDDIFGSLVEGSLAEVVPSLLLRDIWDSSSLKASSVTPPRQLSGEVQGQEVLDRPWVAGYVTGNMPNLCSRGMWANRLHHLQVLMILLAKLFPLTIQMFFLQPATGPKYSVLKQGAELSVVQLLPQDWPLLSLCPDKLWS